MNIASLKQSKFLSRADVGQTGKLLTIRNIYKETVSSDEGDEEKYCVGFNEPVKPMILNSTNAQLIAAALGSEETDNWAGRKIVVFDDPNVNFKGKLTGGIRCRAPRTAPPPAPAPAPLPVEDDDSEIPF